MNWKDRITTHKKLKVKFEKAKARFGVIASEWTTEKSALLTDIKTETKADGSDPFVTSGGRTYGESFRVTKGCANEEALVKLLVQGGHFDLLKPRVGEAHTAYAQGSFDEKIEKKISRLLTTTPVPYLADRKAK